MNTKHRILQIIDEKKITKHSFLRKAGVHRGLLDGDKLDGAVTDRNLMQIHAAYPEINILWLVCGEGDMYVPTTILPPDVVTIDRYEKKVEECARLRFELEQLKQSNTTVLPHTNSKS